MKQTNTFIPPKKHPILLHCCCAPCSGGIIGLLDEYNIEFDIFFSNSNIYPESEYTKRKKALSTLASKYNRTVIFDEFKPKNWTIKTSGLENEPERGRRCQICYSIRLEETAKYALKNGYPIFTSSLGISRWKPMDVITKIGKNIASKYPSLEYWDYNWRKNGGVEKMLSTIHLENIYMQKYCGCRYSIRQENTP